MGNFAVEKWRRNGQILLLAGCSKGYLNHGTLLVINKIEMGGRKTKMIFRLGKPGTD